MTTFYKIKNKKSWDFNLDFDGDKVPHCDGGASGILDYNCASVFRGDRGGEEGKGQTQTGGTVEEVHTAETAEAAGGCSLRQPFTL